MAVVKIRNQPELTVGEAIDIFRRHCTGKYEVHKSWHKGRDFGIEQSRWVGVGVRLEQKADRTSFLLTYYTPSVIIECLTGLTAGVLGTLLRILIFRTV